MPDTEDLVLRPEPMRGATGTGMLLAGGWVVASVAFLLRLHGILLVAASVVDATIVLAIVFAAVVLRPRYAVGVRNGELFYRSPRGERIVLGRGQPARVVQVDATQPRGTADPQPVPFWLLVRPDNSVALKLERSRWQQDGLEALRKLLGLPLEVIDGPKTVRDLRATYRGVTPWWSEHPWRAAAIFWGAVLSLGVFADLLLRG